MMANTQMISLTIGQMMSASCSATYDLYIRGFLESQGEPPAKPG